MQKPLSAQTQAGRYEVVRLIGRGGMGAVYEARDTALGRRVALKTISTAAYGSPDETFQRLSREARLLATLTHPNIVAVYDVFLQEGAASIVMELVRGRELETLLRKTPPGEWKQFLPVLRPCAQALDFAHQNGIVHRDIKPGNIMVQDDGTPKILDFGLARQAFDHQVTQDGLIVGTLNYLAPEMVQGERATPRSDQYSLAVIAYRLLAGKLPFESENTASLLYKIVSVVPEPIEGDPEAARAIARALSKDADSRYSSCTDFANDLQFGERWQKAEAALRSAIQQFPTPAKPPAPGPPPAAPAQNDFTRMFRPPVAASSPTAEPDGEQTMMLRRPADTRITPAELARRQAAELIEIAREEAFDRGVNLAGKWLPGVEGADPPLLAFREAARYLLAARSASSVHNAVEHLARADSLLVAAGNQLLQDRTPLAGALPEALYEWKQYTRTRLQRGREQLARQLPNPFRAGQPLRPDQGRSVFRGREEIVRQMESILADPNQSGSIALLGPRRCGKTSLLQMLPVLLPDCVCVFFDLQDNPVDSTPAFFQALERQAREQARRDRRIELPPLADGGTFSSASEWFQALDSVAGGVRILVCLDEFERLEDLFPSSRQDLLRLMGLFRATIQHRRQLRLLVSGVAPFDELGQIWNDHFINVREIRVGHLERDAAIDLLRHPMPDFPPEAVPYDVAARVFERTGGQPYLLQLYGSLLLSRLNEQERRVASLDDMAPVEAEAMSQGAYYFRHTYEAAPEKARKALEEFAAGGTPALAPQVRRWLERRGLLTDAGTLHIPVLATFMQEELGL